MGRAAALRRRGGTPLPRSCPSLKEPVAAETITSLLAETGAGIVLNGTGFSLPTPGEGAGAAPLAGAGGPGVGGVAPRRPRPARPRYRHERGPARGGRPHHHPRRVLQGRGALRCGDPV